MSNDSVEKGSSPEADPGSDNSISKTDETDSSKAESTSGSPLRLVSHFPFGAASVQISRSANKTADVPGKI